MTAPAAAPPSSDLAGPRKAAVLLLSLSTEQAAAMLKRLPEHEVETILAEVAQLDDVDPEVMDAVFTDFAAAASTSRGAAGGTALARRLLATAVGTDRAEVLAETLFGRRPFEFLFALEPRLAAGFLADEHPQTIALVLSRIPSELAAELLKALPDEFRRDVAVRIATLDKTSPEVLELIEAHLAQRFATITVDDQRPVGGISALVDLLSRSDDATEKAVVEGLREVDEGLADQVRAAMFSFEDLTVLSDREVQQVLRGVDSKDLAVALKGAADPVQKKILGNLSSRAADTLREEIELLGRVRMAAIEEARASVMRVVRELEEQGQIVLERAGDDFVD